VTAGRVIGALLASVLVVAFLLVAVFPTRTLLNQRSQTSRSRSELAELRASNAQLSKRIEELHSPDAIERIARRDYNMVRPGEESYAILPRASEPVVLPDVWPFAGAADTFNR
jgi:cell division protein FtsB